MNTRRKTYSELSNIDTFKDRYEYCKIQNSVGSSTFGYSRYLNQNFYRSVEWKRVRDSVIIRDNGCDLGVPDHPISGKIYIHHLNPLTLDDVSNNSEALLDPDNLVCVSHSTHNAIHFGDETIIKDKTLIERTKNDTCPWKKG